MATVPAVDGEAVTMIDAAIDDYRAFLPRHRRERIKQLCLESIAFGLEEPHAASVRTQFAAQLLLDLLCPQVNWAVRDTLAYICADIAEQRA